MPLKPCSPVLRRAWPLVLSLAAFLGACASRQEPPAEMPPGASADAAPATDPAPGLQAMTPDSPAPSPPAVMATFEDYKREVARRISQGSASHLFEGAPPSLLKSVVVLSIAVDAEGQLRRVAVLRSNGFRALEQLALQSVKVAAPLPRPGAFATRRGLAEFTETWLFRDDNRFQIRSLAPAQAEG